MGDLLGGSLCGALILRIFCILSATLGWRAATPLLTRVVKSFGSCLGYINQQTIFIGITLVPAW